MKATEFKKLIKESVREVIQEELREILLEAVRAPKTTVVQESRVADHIAPQTQSQTQTQSLPQTHGERHAILESIMGDMHMGQRGKDELSFTSQDAMGANYNPRATPGADLAPGNVGIDQIMGLMKGK
tara:strand:+ start:382 stop:765 length:384 start_codon:yes stop_codon:yes gene_type:complete